MFGDEEGALFSQGAAKSLAGDRCRSGEEFDETSSTVSQMRFFTLQAGGARSRIGSVVVFITLHLPASRDNVSNIKKLLINKYH